MSRRVSLASNGSDRIRRLPLGGPAHSLRALRRPPGNQLPRGGRPLAGPGGAAASALRSVVRSRFDPPHAERAVRLARGLHHDHHVSQDAVYGILAEAFVSLCANASTPKRALLYERGRRAALRALELQPGCPSAHYALGLQCLFTPEAFGGAPKRAIPHLECVLRRQPAHAGARMALAEALARVGANEACGRELARLRASAPALAKRLERRLRGYHP